MGVIFFGGSEKRKDWACTIVHMNTIGRSYGSESQLKIHQKKSHPAVIYYFNYPHYLE